jgi:hypothetical protein
MATDPTEVDDDSKDLIQELVAMNEAQLIEKLGFDDQVDNFQKNMKRADKLTGAARQKVLNQLSSMFTPDNFRIADIGYTIDRAEEKASGKTTPSSILAGCCDCGDD